MVGRKHVHRLPFRMGGEEVSSARFAEVAVASLGFMENTELVRSFADFQRLRLPEGEGVDRPARPLSTGATMTVAGANWVPGNGDSTAPQKQLPL